MTLVLHVGQRQDQESEVQVIILDGSEGSSPVAAVKGPEKSRVIKQQGGPNDA
jgi:hypothetical protein